MPDMGNFTLHALGETLAIDIGYGRWETSSNNCVVVDGKGQRQDWQGNPGGLAEHDLREDVQYARGNLTRQYPGSRRADRHSLFVQAGDGLPWYVVIGDDFEMDDGGAHDYEWVLVTTPGNSIATDARRFTVVGTERNLAGFVAVPDDATLTVDALDHTYYWSPTGAGSSAGDMQHWGDYPRLRIGQRAGRGRFLVVMLPESEAMPTIERVLEGGGFGVRVQWPGTVDEVLFLPVGDPHTGPTGYRFRRQARP